MNSETKRIRPRAELRARVLFIDSELRDREFGKNIFLLTWENYINNPELFKLCSDFIRQNDDLRRDFSEKITETINDLEKNIIIKRTLLKELLHTPL